MGCEAELLAIGKFKPEIAEYLDYPASYYSNCNKDTVIITTLCKMVGTTSSRELAYVLGIKDLWNFNQHEINYNNIKFYDIVNNEYSEITGIHQKLKILCENGFKLYFRPEG